MNDARFAAASFGCAGLIVLAACATNNVDTRPEPDAGLVDLDGAAPGVDAAPADATGPGEDLDAERPLSCGKTGFCETRLPASNIGLGPSLRGVWAVATNDVWSVSAEGVVFHYDGASWTTSYRANHALYAVWATATDVWVGGESGLLFHRQAGGEWKHVETGHVQTIHAIYGTNENDVWFMSRDDSVDHFDGTTLRNHSLDVPGLHVTTLFGRAGFGVYAAGYVEGPQGTSEFGMTMFEHEPYLFELTPTSISRFNASLGAQKGFVPTSGVVTDAPDESQRVFLSGYEYSFFLSPPWSNFSNRIKCFTLGASSPVTLQDPFMSVNTSGDPPPAPSLEMLAPKWNDIQIMFDMGMVFQWSGTEFTRASLNMGYDFMPRAIHDAHGDSKVTWLVGDGFALRRVTP